MNKMKDSIIKFNNKILKNYKVKILICLIIILAVSIFLVYPLIHKVYFTGDDTEFHRANIEIIGECISEGNLGKILPQTANDFGYGIRIFYPNLVHILGGTIYSIIKLVGLNSYDSLKILHFINICCAGIGMFALSKKIFKSNKQALISSIFYITLPYFFVDIYMRDALAESFLFIFVPLVFLSIYYLFYEENVKKFYFFFVLGYTGMINSHLVLSVYFTILFAIFLLVSYRKLLNKKNLIALVIASVIVFGISATFIIGLLQHYAIGGYVVTENKYLLSDLWLVHAIEFFQSYYYKSSEYTLINVNLNYIHVVFGILSTIYIIKNIKKMDKNKRNTIIGLYIIAIISIFLASANFIWKYIPSLLRNIQFAWRLALFVGFASSIIASVGLNMFKKEYQKYVVMILIFLLVITSYYNLNSVKYNIVYNDNMVEYDSNNAMGWQKEYLPQNTKDNLEYYSNRNNDIITLYGNIEYEFIYNKVPELEFEITKVDIESKIELPRLYYLGYELIDSNGKNLELEQNEKGFISVKINEIGRYKLKYTGTILDKIAKCITITALIVCILYIINIIRLKYKNKKTN